MPPSRGLCFTVLLWVLGHNVLSFPQVETAGLFSGISQSGVRIEKRILRAFRENSYTILTKILLAYMEDIYEALPPRSSMKMDSSRHKRMQPRST